MQDFYTVLDNLELLEVSGEDSEKFLQGQLTCDLNNLEDSGWQPGAACNNKGRAYSSFRLLKDNGRCILMLQPGMAEITMNALKKYIPFYKATMANISAGYHRLGFAGDRGEEFLRQQFGNLPAPGKSDKNSSTLIINLSMGTPRYEVWLDTQSPLSGDLPADLPEAPLAQWQLADLQAGLCMIRPEFVETYTPEELNMDLAGFVSFHKGCYTGQEIVARMHFRGKAKKRLFMATLPWPPVKSDNEPGALPASGTAFNILIAGDSCYANVVLPTDHVAPQCPLIFDGDRVLNAEIRPFHYA